MLGGTIFMILYQTSKGILFDGLDVAELVQAFIFI